MVTKHNNTVLLVADFSFGAAGNSYAQSFRVSGFDVIEFESRGPFYKRYRSKKWFRFMEPLWLHVLNKQLVQKAFQVKPTFVVILKGDNISWKSLQKIKKASPSTTLINFYPDNPFVLWNGNSNEDVLRSLPMYDHFIIWSKMLMQPVLSAGACSVKYFPFAYDPQVFPKEYPKSSQYTFDVSFIGTWEKEREKWLTRLVEKLPAINLGIVGNMWHEQLAQDSPLRMFLISRAQYRNNMISLFKSSKINLNFIRKQNMTSHNMRTIEVPASGAFLLTQHTQEQCADLFEEDKSIACFSTIDGLVQKISFYLANDTIRETIKKNAFEKVQHYSLPERLADLMNEVRGG